LVDWRSASGLPFQPCGEAIGGFVEGVASDPSRSTRSSPSFSLGGGKTTGFLETLQSTALGDCLPSWRRLVLPWLGTASPTLLWVEARLRLALPPHCPGAALRLFSGEAVADGQLPDGSGVTGYCCSCTGQIAYRQDDHFHDRNRDQTSSL